MSENKTFDIISYFQALHYNTQNPYQKRSQSKILSDKARKPSVKHKKYEYPEREQIDREEKQVSDKLHCALGLNLVIEHKHNKKLTKSELGACRRHRHRVRENWCRNVQAYAMKKHFESGFPNMAFLEVFAPKKMKVLYRRYNGKNLQYILEDIGKPIVNKTEVPICPILEKDLNGYSGELRTKDINAIDATLQAEYVQLVCGNCDIPLKSTEQWIQEEEERALNRLVSRQRKRTRDKIRREEMRQVSASSDYQPFKSVYEIDKATVDRTYLPYPDDFEREKDYIIKKHKEESTQEKIEEDYTEQGGETSLVTILKNKDYDKSYGVCANIEDTPLEFLSPLK